MASDVLSAAGFTGESLAIALGIQYAEADGPAATAQFGVRSAYSDAVGDLDKIDTKWGPSVGDFQIRTLRDPNSGNAADRLRIADKLRDPKFSADAAWIISKHGTDFSLWSTFVHGTYLPFKGLDFELRTGHKNAQKWNA
jgi:hypothetical protein